MATPLMRRNTLCAAEGVNRFDRLFKSSSICACNDLENRDQLDGDLG
jgi:hypothetical protein